MSPVIHSQMVCWKKPVSGYVKLNVDGCTKGNPGSTGGGGIIRDHHGELVKAFSDFYGIAVIILPRKTKAHWQIKHVLERIWELSRTGDFQFRHIFREGNKIADQLANLGEDIKAHGIFTQAVSLPREVRASSKFEQEGIPNFRFRVKEFVCS